MKSYYDDENVPREDDFGDSIKKIIYIIVGIVLVKALLSSGMFFKDSLNGPGYSMAAPVGWKKVDRKLIEKLEDENTTIAAYVTHEKSPLTDLPLAQIAVYSIRLPQHMWMEDEYPTILSALKKSGVEILDKGSLKIQEKEFMWVLTDSKAEDVVSLQFFLISGNKMFYKLVYSSTGRAFNEYRRDFDLVKDTFKLRLDI